MIGKGEKEKPFAAEGDVGESTAVAAERDGLILEVAFASLVTNGAIQRMVDQQELHDTLTCLSRQI